jgi:hypothetical protein
MPSNWPGAAYGLGIRSRRVTPFSQRISGVFSLLTLIDLMGWTSDIAGDPCDGVDQKRHIAMDGDPPASSELTEAGMSLFSTARAACRRRSNVARLWSYG